MLRLIDPDERPPELAYRVPWLIEVSTAPLVTVTNASDQTLTGALVTLLRTGELLTPHASRIGPGETLTFAFPVDEPIESAVALLAWTRNGSEYLYRIVL